jgi:hypothetical protein
MIEIHLTKSKDLEAIGVKKLWKNEIYIGHSSGDIIIDDQQVINHHLFIEILEQEGVLLCHPHPKIDHFLVNGKRCESPRKLLAGDSFAIGINHFEVISFKPEHIQDFDQQLKNNLDELISKNSELLEIIKKIKIKMENVDGK